jgi:hypothetical protein
LQQPRQRGCWIHSDGVIYIAFLVAGAFHMVPRLIPAFLSSTALGIAERSL